jgi:AcrR family transcriptional regulator
MSVSAAEPGDQAVSAAFPLPADASSPGGDAASDVVGDVTRNADTETPHLEATRRRLTERQAETVAELVRAAAAEVDEVGYDGVTVRGVARRAGVAPATAYQYFSSKDHLLAETLWRHLGSLPPVVTDGQPLRLRIEEAVRGLVLFAAENPARADACTAALLGSNPDVKHLRDRIGAHIHRRLATALGPDADPEAVRVLETSYFGALLMAGMGHLSYLDIPAFVTGAAELILGNGPSPSANRARP